MHCIIISILNCDSILKLLQYCNSYSHANKAYVVVVVVISQQHRGLLARGGWAEGEVEESRGLFAVEKKNSVFRKKL